MKVVDLLKHKKDSIARPQLELKELVSPAIKEYWSDLVTKANAQILPWNRNETPANEGQQRPDASTNVSNVQNKNNLSGHISDTNSETAVIPSASLVNDLPEKAQALYHEIMATLGEETHVGDWIDISQDRINEFAKVTEDMQWIHTDPERAGEESPFKTTIAHGFLTLSMLSRMTDSVDEKNPPFPDAKMTVNIGLNKVRFPYPVKSGNRIRSRSRILTVTPVKRGLEIEREIKVEIDGVRRPGCIAVSVIRLYF